MLVDYLIVYVLCYSLIKIIPASLLAVGFSIFLVRWKKIKKVFSVKCAAKNKNKKSCKNPAEKYSCFCKIHNPKKNESR